MVYRAEAFAEQRQDIVYLIHTECFFPLFQFPDKAKADTGPLGQFDLRETVFLPFFFDMC